ncbi:MAG: dienelactone hydrolase family protein [Oscillospiraceae bacterium]|nr:dienelactone hydrolase family protein [Oscillospiraceae bacterium]
MMRNPEQTIGNLIDKQTTHNKKHIAVQMTLCAGIIGVAGIFIYFGMGAFVWNVAEIAAIVLLLNLALRGAGSLICRKYNVKSWLKQTCAVVLVILNLLVPICGITYAVQDGMWFYNIHDPESRAFLQARQSYHEVQFTAENGKTYHGMMYRTSNESAPLVIYFGGNGEVSYRNLLGREERDEWQYFAEHHYIFIDYEGYGLNDGNPHYLNMYEQALAVFDYAAALPYVESSNIVTMGYSLGTGNAVYLAANRPVAGLILATPYANGYDLYNNMFPIFKGPIKFLVKQKLPSDQHAPNVTCPVLVFASRSDESVPFSSSERLAELFGAEVEFITLENTLHNDVFGAGGVFDKVQSFLEGVKSR